MRRPSGAMAMPRRMISWVRQSLEVPAVKDDAAGLDRRQAGDGPEGGGLAGAVGPQQGHDPAPGGRQTDPVQGLDGPVGDFEIENFQHK